MALPLVAPALATALIATWVSWLIGAGAFLAAAMQGPVASAVLLLELAHRSDALLVPLLLAIAGAGLVARRIEPRSIYSARIHSGRAAATVEEGRQDVTRW